MSNTNIPPIDPASLRRIADNLEEREKNRSVTTKLWRANTESLKDLKQGLINFATPMVRLRESINRMDDSNRKLTQMGTTYSKLEASLRKNSEVLNQNVVSTRALVTEIGKSFEQGIRDNGGAIGDLTKEMIATGQDAAGQRKMNASLILQTGNNIDVVKRLNQTNIDVSDKYGVSNDRLIQSINSLKSAMDDASLFGPEAVEGMTNIAFQLKGRAAGNDIEAGLNVLSKILTPDSSTLAMGSLLGARGSRQKQGRGQGVDMGDVTNVLKNFQQIMIDTQSINPEARTLARTSRTGLDKQSVIALNKIVGIMDNDFSLSQSEKATDAEKANNLKNIQEKAASFYDGTAKSMLSTLGSIDTNFVSLSTDILMLATLAGGSFGGMGGFLARSGKPQAGIGAMASKGNRLGGALKGGAVGLALGAGIGMVGDAAGVDLTGTSTGVALGAVLGPLGMAVGGIAGGIYDLVQNTSKSAKADEARLEMEQEEKRSERAKTLALEDKNLQFMTGWARSRGLMPNVMTSAEDTLLLESIDISLRSIALDRQRNAAMK